jgi:hypothetical protein
VKQKEIEKWQSIIKNGEAQMKDKRDRWDELYDRYNLDLHVSNLADEDVVKVSRFYPLIRKLIASVAYNYPRIFIHLSEGELLNRFTNAEGTLERAADQALKLTNMKREIHQCMFEALFTFRSFLKVGYNPPGDDAVSPYVVNDDLQDDFPYVQWVSAKNIIVDPLLPPHNFSAAQYVIERQLVPLEFARKDRRFEKFKNQFKPISKQRLDDFNDTLFSEDGFNDEADGSYVNTARNLTEMVMLYEIHDRTHRRRIVFANDIEEPVEDVPHPMLRHKPIIELDPFTQEEVVVGTEATNSFLMPGGFQYYTLSYDLSNKFWGEPMMAYEETIEQLIIDSVSRRQDLLKRFKRFILGANSERQQNPQLPDNLNRVEDGGILWVNNPNAAFQSIDFGAAPPDQVGLERDALRYEAEIIQVDTPSADSATEAAVRASSTEVNREWMQMPVANAYRWAIKSMFNMFSDSRYIPEAFYVNVGRDGEPAMNSIMESWWFEGRWDVEIDPASMLVLNEKMERNDTLALYDRLIAMPFPINRKEVMKLLGSAFRKVNFTKLLQPEINPDAAGLAQMENTAYLVRGGEIPPQPGQDHQTHMQVHNNIQSVAEFQQLLPQQQQQVLQLVQQHNQQHQELMNQEGGTKGRQTRPSEQSNATDLTGQVRSNAQQVSNTIRADVQANAQ